MRFSSGHPATTRAAYAGRIRAVERLVAVGLVLIGVTARATLPAAEALFQEGRVLLTEGKVEEACARFARSHELEPGLGTLLNLADCAERAGRFSAAYRAFREASKWAARRDERKREEAARQRARALEPRLVLLTIDARPGQAVAVIRSLETGQLALEGAIVEHEPFALEPGVYGLTVSANGFMPYEARVEQRRPAEVRLFAELRRRAPPAARSAKAGAGAWALGLSGGAVAVAATGAVFFSQLTFAAVARQQPGGSMFANPTVTRAEYEFAQAVFPASLVALVVGAGALVSGILWGAVWSTPDEVAP